MNLDQDRGILRELAKQYAEIAADEKNNERRERARGINSLRPARPIVWLDELPWHEMDIDGELICRCENQDAREIETWLRRNLYQWRHIQADMIAEPAYPVTKAFDQTGVGVSIQEERVESDASNPIVSHKYLDQLKNEADVKKLRIPVINARPDIDIQKMGFAEDMLGDALPVRLRGHGVYHAPWDDISELRGVESVLIDMIDRPEHLHKIRKFFMDAGYARYEQMERQGLLDYDTQSLHCTPPYVDDLPAGDYDGGRVRMKDVWFRGMAQMFSTVSPDFFEEFELAYTRPLMARFGLSYYGCCESLDNFLPLLTRIPNMRKLGVSPWSNVKACAEMINKNYVVARKPNPAFVSGSFDEEVVRKETEETVTACLANGCPYELVLKDVSTVSYKPGNLISWVRAVSETIDKYY